MKVKITRDKNHLTVKTVKNERLEYVQAEHLKQHTDTFFLPFTYEATKDGHEVFSYDISDAIPLSTYLGAKLSFEQFHTMLVDLVCAVEACSKYEFDYINLLFDYDYVYINSENNRAILAYMPASFLDDKRATILDLLRNIATHTMFAYDNDQADATSLLDYLKKQTIFSLASFKEFIASKELEHNAVSSSGFEQQSFGGQGHKAKETTGPTIKSASTYDFVKAQAGTMSAQESYKAKSLIEQVEFSVADKPSITDSATLVVSSGSLKEDPISEPTPQAEPKPEPQAQSQPTPKDMKYELIRESTSERYPLPTQGQAILGRSKKCSITIGNNPGISRIHAIITTQKEGCYITDQNSTNGTKVEKIKLTPNTPTILTPGSRITLGEETFVLVAGN